MLLPLALTLLGLAILALLVTPWLLDVIRSYARLRALRPAWRVLTELHPEVRLRPTRAWSLRTWLEIRERRTIIELEDAQRLQRLHDNSHSARPDAASEAELPPLLHTPHRARSTSARLLPAIQTESRER